MSSFQPINCSVGSPPALEANPDIAGVGVLIGFATSAYATLLLCTAYYLVDTRNLQNRVDSLCIETVSHAFGRKGRTKSTKYRIALQEAVLTFSDSQVITGIAILISGYTQLHGGLAAYHWQIAVDLAWFSSITHLTTLTCLRRYFRDNPAPRIVRLMCMGVLAVMLTCALASTGYWNNDYSSLMNGYPAQCFYHPDADLKKQGYNGVYIALAAGLIGVSYIIRIPQLFSKTSEKINDLFHTGPRNFLKSSVEEARKRAAAPERFAQLFWTSVSLSVFWIYCLLGGAVELYGSLLWEITWLFFALAWGTIRVLQDRNGYAPDDSDHVSLKISQEDNIWGFGQVIAVSLLIVPCMSFYTSVSKSDNSNNEQHGNVGDNSERENESTNERPDNPPSLLPDSSIEPTNSFNHDLYQYSWFRAMIILIYGLSLEMAAQVLYIFPYSRLTADPNKADFGRLALGFLMYFAFDLGLVFTFCGVCVLFQNMDPISETPEMNRQRALIRRKWVQSILWNVPVAILLAGSAVLGYFLFDDSKDSLSNVIYY